MAGSKSRPVRRVRNRLEWRRWVTPTRLRQKPVHRWFAFPHSYTDDLVLALCDEWGLSEADHLLDPFAGAGTTLIAAKARGIAATGYDISPLAVLASRVKLASFEERRLRRLREHLRPALTRRAPAAPAHDYPELVTEALPGRLLSAFDHVQMSIAKLSCTPIERDFFRLALLAILPEFSRAVASGGWLKWVDKRPSVTRLAKRFLEQTELMLSDVTDSSERRRRWTVRQADARRLPVRSARYSAVITSPPYPNRHDYTRVFGVELMFGFCSWEAARRLRYQSLHSHPEAKPRRPSCDDYVEPAGLARAIAQVQDEGCDPRVARMLRGYFLDTHLCLREMQRVVRDDGRIGLVVGNAQYHGVAIPVDEFVAEIGERLGLRQPEIMVARYRGNSAQQMRVFGRNPSRESVVAFRR